ncbi:YgjV family protein [Galbibacter mesophilus]|uniref:YgjV family protein n=1 Tax=Galbibacter mesophilus TaxID=379069 RepID=UPI00191DA97C|nr:YgjV family protein [Galbibacter mesophilus]MCM5661560.1 YgjV family protein [Galbibacter mesophilus]
MEYFSTSPTELIGYAASIGVLLSFFMKEIRRLRVVNSIGCLLFVIYGFLLPSIPVILTNIAILGVNFYYLIFRKDKV